MSASISSSLSPRSSLVGLLAAASLAGALLTPHRALAADLDPSYADIPPAQQQVTFGSGWYVRGDIAATDETYKVASTAGSAGTLSPELFRTNKVGYNATLGGGYAFLNSVRGDVTADFLQPKSYVATTYVGTGRNASFYSFAGHLNQYAALANGYYDFSIWSVVTPYVGVGAGVGFVNAHVNFTDINKTAVGARYINLYNFAFAAMAGVAIDVYSHTKLDIGYRYLDLGKVLGRNVSYNEIRAGLRYMIDN